MDGNRNGFVSSATDRLISEQRFHDAQARQRAVWFAQYSARLCFSDADYLDHETWIRPAFTELGNVRELDVLDYGCGHGMAAVVLARAGARVTAFDLSPGYVTEAKSRAAANGVGVSFVQADAERLPFPDASFDRVWGNAVLHHLDLVEAAREVRRILRPDGRAVFCEPWGENALLRWARTGQRHTRDEQPLRCRQLRVLRDIFPTMKVRGFQLLAMARRLVPAGRMIAGLERCDTALLDCLPRLQRYCRYVVLTLDR
jgi:SAM-dependent methyltransferase